MARQKASRVYFLVGVLMMALIFFDFIGWLNPLKRLSRSLFVPFASVFRSWNIKLREMYIMPSERKKLVNSYKECEQRRIADDTLEAENKILKEQNVEFKKQLEFKQRKSWKTITTEVIGGSVDSAGKNILVRGGLDMGIKSGQPVIVDDGVLVGLVNKAEETVSIIRLLTDNQTKVAATLLNRDKSLGVVEGGYGISIWMNFIPRNETMRVGDQVITSGLEPNIPRGLLIGEVAAAVNEPYQPFQQAILTPEIDLSKLTTVTILLTN